MPSEAWGQRQLAASVLASVTAMSGAGVVHVAPGDTLWGLARTSHTSVAALQQANGLHTDRIYAGSVLRLPSAGAALPHRGASRPAATREVRYRVGPGDYLIAIASRFGVSPRVIAARNRLRSADTVILGSTLIVPVPALPPAPEPARESARLPAGTSRYSAATTAAAAASRAVLAGRPRPSKASVRATIRATALRLGVDPSLALAVTYQESGFQQHVVSPANAIGAMQVLPSTGAWLSADVAGRRLDLYNTADNAVAGVGLLHQLLRTETPANAVAAYYQGLGSLRRHGQYAETKTYVRSVLSLQARFR